MVMSCTMKAHEGVEGREALGRKTGCTGRGRVNPHLLAAGNSRGAVASSPLPPLGL